MLATRKGAGICVEGDPDHPANFGRLCSKGAALADVLVPNGRLLRPKIDGDDVDWDTAVQAVAKRFKDAISEHGPDSVAFYVSGQILTEDYYVANKLMKGFIGSANIDTNSRLCMASSVAGHKRAFGEDVVPVTYEDLEQADLLVLTGSNLAWCHPVLHQRIMAAKAARPDMTIVAIDPRETATTQQADLHLAINPSSDVALFEGLLTWLNKSGARDAAYVDRHVDGMDAALAAAKPMGVRETALETGLSVKTVKRFFDLFARTDKTVTVYSQGINQATDGTDRVGAIINCHLLTGRIGQPGMGPFSITGQPNAMGGREVGGLANQLACHMDIENRAHRKAVQAFWQSPAICDAPGLKAVDMFDAVADGRIKAIWIMATNPVDSLPNADKVRAALEACSTVVVSDVTADTDTAACADILLPAAAWGEKDGTVTNSERRMSRQRKLRDLPGDARPDWAALSAVGRAMGWHSAFDYETPAQVFREYAAMTELNVGTGRQLDLTGLKDISDADYDALRPIQWPVPQAGAQGGRLFANGAFAAPTAKARAITPAEKPAQTKNPAFPYVLNTGRIRDQWHSMTRTGLSPKLSQHFAEPFAEIHPRDALREGIAHASLVRLTSPYGAANVRALVTRRQQPGSVFTPMHWTGQNSSAGRIDAVVAPRTDPISGQPASKNTPVRLEPLDAQWHAFVVSRQVPTIDTAYWARAACNGGVRLELAGGNSLVGDIEAWARQTYKDAQWLHYRDESAERTRLAIFDGQRLLCAAYVSRGLLEVSRQWVVNQFSTDAMDEGARLKLLAGRPSTHQGDDGAIICSCMAVGINKIRAAARPGSSVKDIGEKTGAGTNCGSCRGEIQGILAQLEANGDAVAKAI